MKSKLYGLMVVLSIFAGLAVTLGISTKSWGLSSQQIAQKTFPSVALLVMEDVNRQSVSMGSGFFVGDNVIATNLHVIKGAKEGYAKIVGQETKYEIYGTVGIDEDMDLVLLSLKGAKAPPLQLGNIRQVQVGDEIYVVGNPLGLEGTFSKGIISGIREVASETIIQLTAPISPGSSGGPVINTKGEVVGVAVATFQGGQNLNFAIPASYLASLLSKTTPIISLSRKKGSNLKKSIFDSFGNSSIAGIVARKFLWEYDPLTQYGSSRSFSFSLYNKLRKPVTEVLCLVIFYDDEG